MTNESIALKNIKVLMQLNKIGTKKELAEKLNITKQQIRYWYFIGDIPAKYKYEVARLFNVNVEVLVQTEIKIQDGK